MMKSCGSKSWKASYYQSLRILLFPWNKDCFQYLPLACVVPHQTSWNSENSSCRELLGPLEDSLFRERLFYQIALLPCPSNFWSNSSLDNTRQSPHSEWYRIPKRRFSVHSDCNWLIHVEMTWEPAMPGSTQGRNMRRLQTPGDSHRALKPSRTIFATKCLCYKMVSQFFFANMSACPSTCNAWNPLKSTLQKPMANLDLESPLGLQSDP